MWQSKRCWPVASWLSFAKQLPRFFVRKGRILKRLLSHEPLKTPPFGFATLDRDDVVIAREALGSRENWYDETVIREYENAFASWNGSRYAFSFMGGRVALSACISALGLGPGDEVIVPGYTCVAVPNAFEFAGIKIVYCDIELDTYGLDAKELAEKITGNTKAVLLHHLYGLVCRDYEKVVEIARGRGLRVIEDCCQSAGAEFKGMKVGRLGDAAIYSSEQSKVFTTIEGGFATCDDESLATKLNDYWESAPYPNAERTDNELYTILTGYRMYADPQWWWKGELYRLLYADRQIVTTTPEEERGIKPSHYGCKMPAAIAAVGLNQLRKVDAYNEMRRRTARRWDDWCDQNGYHKPYVVPGSTPVFLRYPIMVEPEKKRDTTWALEELGVSLGVWFISNIHPSKRVVLGCPNADAAVRQCVNLPTIIK